ncbi:MAG: serine hydrolase [Bacteroidota bacterium]|nr:serine hydrolase [Bacteroidota bacterium]MDP4236092.1 serine hydrolase [Bacteroidota bacterium]
MTTRCFSVLYVLCLLWTHALAQPTADNFKTIDDSIEALMPEWHIPGCTVAIVYKDSIVHAKAFGSRDLGRHLPVTTETVFRIGSLTKSFTALSCAILQDRKKLDLDKPIHSYFKDFLMYNDELTGGTTTRDLLSHRTGLPRYDKLTDYNSFSTQDVYHRLRYLEPTKSFRSAFQYTNLMYEMAGLILEKRSGESWSGFIEHNITSPLGMTHTYFDLRHYEASTDRAMPYDFDDSIIATDNSIDDKDETNAAGSISSTIGDMSKYAIALLHEGRFAGKNIIPKSAIVECFTPNIFTGGLKYPEIFYESYGLGWFLNSYKGHLRINHEGNYDGFSASVCLLPQDTFAIVILTNMHQTGFVYVSRNLIIDRMLGKEITDWNSRIHGNAEKKETEDSLKDTRVTPSKAKGNTVELSRYSGTYTNPAFGKIVITATHGGLQYDLNGIETGVLSACGEHRFVADLRYDEGMVFTFIQNADKRISALTLPLEEALGHDIGFIRSK